MARNKIHEQILEQLDRIEERNYVRVLYACESGSRAWGFESADSDYDVRFIYLHKPEWYLSIRENQRDVIEYSRPCPDNGNMFDMSGWDLRKALNLYRKSNPNLLEWLVSPTQYKVSSATCQQLTGTMMPMFFSQKRAMYHYFHMAKGNYRTYLQGSIVWLKKYLYVLRPILACLHIERGMGMPPVYFTELLVSLDLSKELAESIVDLVLRKREGGELACGPRVDNISEFIERELDRMGGNFSEYADNSPSYKPLERVFRMALSDIYGLEI